MDKKTIPKIEWKILVKDEEAANALSLTTSQIRFLREKHGLPHYKFGRTIRYSLEDIKEWIKKYKTTQKDKNEKRHSNNQIRHI